MIADDYKVYIKNVSLEDDEISELLKQAVEDIASETRVFKTIVGFSVEPDVEYYDFEAIFGLYCATVTDIKTLSFSSPITLNDIMNGVFPDMVITNTVDYPKPDHMILDVNDIFDTEGKSITERFTFLSGYNYRNKLFDEKIDKVEPYQAAAVISFVPDPKIIDEDIERRIRPAIIAGLKYFANDIYNDTDNAQVANLYYQRYFAAKRELINKYPVSAAIGRRDSSKKYV